MELDAKQIRRVLQENGIRFLYHANTLVTPCSFLQEGALLSRSAVEKRHLDQTSQKSDPIDKKFRIWNDVFLDVVDIHVKASNRNVYGPILFLIDLKMLGTSVKSVWITKRNPVDWVARDKKAERFYSSVEEFRKSYFHPSRPYKGQDFGAMIMLRNVNGVLPLKGVLRKLVVDEPNTKFKTKGKIIQASDYAVKMLRTAAKVSGLKNIRIERRSCSAGCGCHADYRQWPFMVKEKFALQRDKDVLVHLGY